MKSLSLKLLGLSVALGISQLSAAPIGFDFEGSAQGFTTVTGIQDGGGLPWALTAAGCAGASSGCFFVNDPNSINDHYLVSPLLTTGVNSPTLSFDHSRGLEDTYDGGVVEIALNAGSFFDVFVDVLNPWISNGYNGTISDSFGSPIAGRMAFTGTILPDYVNSSIPLHTVLAGDTLQLRWRRASDIGVDAQGWVVDNILLSDGALSGGALSDGASEGVPEPGYAIPVVLAFSGMVLARRRRGSVTS